MTSIYLIHSKHDQTQVERIKFSLAAWGFNVLNDKNKKNADLVLFMMSPDAYKDSVVKEELVIVSQSRVGILPIQIKGDSNLIKKFEFSKWQIVDMRGDEEVGLQKLVSELRALGVGSRHGRKFEEKRGRQSRENIWVWVKKKKRVWQWLIGIVVVAGVIFGVMEYRYDRARDLRREGDSLAEAGGIEEAIRLYGSALRLNLNWNFDPEIRAEEKYGIPLMKEADALARGGQIEEANQLYETVLQLNTFERFNPQNRAKEVYANRLVGDADIQVMAGRIEKSLEFYELARDVYPQVVISADNWNALCWIGSLERYASEVMFACEQAVALEPDHGGIRDSRGLARALTGDFEGAIQDFEYYIEWSSSSQSTIKRVGWILVLKAGENPFTDEVLAALKNE